MLHRMSLTLLLAFVFLMTACGPATISHDQEVAVALTQTAAAPTAAPVAATATPVAIATTASAATTAAVAAAPAQSAGQWQRYTNPELGFTLQYPAHWQQAALPAEDNGARQGVTLSGSEGAIDLWWGQGFGGACPQGTQPVAVATGTLDACYTQAPDGTESWEQMGKVLGKVGFLANARTLNNDPASRDLILGSLATLSFPAENTASSPAPATRSITVRLDPAQSSPSTVAIYAEVPGEGPYTLGETYFLAEGDGKATLQLDLPAAGYLIYGYSLDFEDLSYFGAWQSAGGLAFIDGATVTEVVLQRPVDPCNANYQLHGSPDGRFPATGEPAILERFGCGAAASAVPASATVAGPEQSELFLAMNGSGEPVYLQLDADEVSADPATGDLYFYFWEGVDQLQAVNGARLLPVTPETTLPGCLEPNAQLFSADAHVSALSTGAAYCVYTSGGRVALVQITNRVDVPQTGQSSVTVVVAATEKGGVMPAAAPSAPPATVTPAAGIDTTQWYRLTNQFLGEGRALDTYADGENAPFMGQTGDYSGQYWKLTPIGDGWYRLTNQFLGDGRALDTYADGENAPFMGQTGDYSGQAWKLTPMGEVQ
jgi:hypothetical protein